MKIRNILFILFVFVAGMLTVNAEEVYIYEEAQQFNNEYTWIYSDENPSWVVEVDGITYDHDTRTLTIENYNNSIGHLVINGAEDIAKLIVNGENTLASTNWFKEHIINGTLTVNKIATENSNGVISGDGTINLFDEIFATTISDVTINFAGKNNSSNIEVDTLDKVTIKGEQNNLGYINAKNVKDSKITGTFKSRFLTNNGVSKITGTTIDVEGQEDNSPAIIMSFLYVENSNIKIKSNATSPSGCIMAFFATIVNSNINIINPNGMGFIVNALTILNGSNVNINAKYGSIDAYPIQNWQNYIDDYWNDEYSFLFPVEKYNPLLKEPPVDSLNIDNSTVKVEYSDIGVAVTGGGYTGVLNINNSSVEITKKEGSQYGIPVAVMTTPGKENVISIENSEILEGGQVYSDVLSDQEHVLYYISNEKLDGIFEIVNKMFEVSLTEEEQAMLAKLPKKIVIGVPQTDDDTIHNVPNTGISTIVSAALGAQILIAGSYILLKKRLYNLFFL